MIQRPKVPLIALVLSLIFPGLGHIYAKQTKKGIAFILITFLVLIPPIVFIFSDSAKNNIFLLLPVFFLLLASAFIATDAYSKSKIYNRAYQLESALRLRWPLSAALAILYFTFCIVATDYWTVYAVDNIALPFMVGSHSMEPTLIKEELYLLDKRIYSHRAPERGDIVIFRRPDVPRQDIIKRIVGLPGESVAINQGRVLVNGKPTPIPGAEDIVYTNRGPLGKAGIAVKIPPGWYFVLGDNSAHSIDSREWGFVERKNIRGKVLKIKYPLNKWGALTKKNVDLFWRRMEQQSLNDKFQMPNWT